jgi:hypothetical protein
MQQHHHLASAALGPLHVLRHLVVPVFVLLHQMKKKAVQPSSVVSAVEMT